MVSEAAEITATRLDRRLEITCAGDELGRLGRTLNDMIERLESSFSRVRQFTADAAHELRTPLAVIRSSTRSPCRGPLASNRIAGSSRKWWKSRSVWAESSRSSWPSAARIMGRSRRVTKRDPARRARARGRRADADRRGREGRYLERGDFSPACVQGDADRLRQLLINVLDNAIKYTPSGGSVIVNGTTADGRVVIEVIDSGAGIPAEHLQDVFERFYRVDALRSRGIDGTGLGLALCRSIAEAHQGRIWIASELGGNKSVPRVAVLGRRSRRSRAGGSSEPVYPASAASTGDGGRSRRSQDENITQAGMLDPSSQSFRPPHLAIIKLIGWRFTWGGPLNGRVQGSTLS